MNKYLRRIVYNWGIRAFGVDHMRSTYLRALRFGEEAIELLQALDVPKDKALALVEMVYARDPGRPWQEVGGTMVTLSVLCQTIGIDPDQVFALEIDRVLDKPIEHFRERNQAKLDAGLR